MNELELLQKSIERIHDAAIDVLNDEGLPSQTRKEVCRIAEESLELCRMTNAYMVKNAKRGNGQGLFESVCAFLLRVVPFLSNLLDEE